MEPAESPPACGKHRELMTRRPDSQMSREQRWCGAWYDCPRPGCRDSALVPSADLLDLLGEQAELVRTRGDLL
jgi:hypothetical protein